MTNTLSGAQLSKLAVHQGTLASAVEHLFNKDKFSINVRKESAFTNATTGRLLELDIYIPELKIAFEFQDIHHYATAWYSHSSLLELQQQDVTKLEVIRRSDITLVLVPCWWDGSHESLVGSIYYLRPDLFAEALPISLNPPFGLLNVGIPDVGELMLPSLHIDAKLSELFVPGNSWWMGEKYDGIRCCWNSNIRKLYTRSHKCLLLDDPLSSLFPKTFIDGEIWFGRGSFSLSQVLAQDDYDYVQWHLLRVVAFDEPNITSQHLSFEKRYRLLLDRIQTSHEFIVVAHRLMCNTQKQMTDYSREIIDNFGEGLVLRQPQSLYEQGRSSVLIKVKTSREDAEAYVVGITAEHVQLKLPNGKTFYVSHEHSSLTQHPQRGDVVTVSYEIFSNSEIPVNPHLLRIRYDLSWNDVLAEHTNNSSLQKIGSPQGYWKKNLRGFFEDAAKKKGVDPSEPETWYGFTVQDIKDLPGGSSIVGVHLQGGLVHTIVRLFTELDLDETKFRSFTRFSSHWEGVAQRRQWFVDFAQDKGLDPLSPQSWYGIELSEIMPQASPIVAHHSGSVSLALLHLFPEIGLISHNFNPSLYWQDVHNRKTFFSEFARKNAFDPLVPDNWYQVWRANLRNLQEIKHIISHHRESIPQTLVDLFPAIGLDLKNFLLHKTKLSDSNTRKKVFTEFAKDQGFDPLIANNWYCADFSRAKRIKAVLPYHDNSISKALSDFYPNIGIDRAKFAKAPQNYWASKTTQRNFFEDFAASKKINPLLLNSWKAVPVREILSFKGGPGVLSQHDNSLLKAVQAVFPELQNSEEGNRSTANWSDASKRRGFFEELARKQKLDPLSADTWYSMSKRTIESSKEAELVLSFHKGSHTLALLELFPELNLDIAKFCHISSQYWQHESNRRTFFENFAKSKGFDPLVPSRWYFTPRKDIYFSKGGSAVLAFYDRSVPKALSALFPSMDLDYSKFEQV